MIPFTTSNKSFILKFILLLLFSTTYFTMHGAVRIDTTFTLRILNKPIPSVVKVNDTLTFEYRLINDDTVNYKGFVITKCAFSHNPSLVYSDSVAGSVNQVIILRKDSFIVRSTIKIDRIDSTSPLGSVVVVWPTGTGIIGGSFNNGLKYVMGTTNIKSTLDENELSIKLSPNPCYDVLSINHVYLGRISYQIIDSEGKAWLSGMETANNIQKLDVKSLPSGIYFLKTRSEEKVSINKFIKL